MGKTSNKIVYLRADASSSIGYGHFSRCLSIAYMLKEHYNCVFVTTLPTSYQIKEIEKICSALILNSEENKLEDFLNMLKGDEIVVLDNYFYTEIYQTQIIEKGCKLIYIDDRKKEKYNCHVVINHVIGVHKEDLVSANPFTDFFLGTKYALLRPSFLKSMSIISPLPMNNTILVAMGGTDYFNYTHKLSDILLKHTSFKIIALVGDAYKYRHTLEELNSDRLTIQTNLAEETIVELIKNVMIVVCPPSTFAYEVCAIGRPFIVGTFAPGQAEAASLLHENDLCTNSGALDILDKNLFIDSLAHTLEKSHLYIASQKNAFDGNQGKRILAIFDNIN